MPQSRVATMANYAFGAPVNGAKATGSVALGEDVDDSNPVSGDQVVLEDSAGNTATFEFGDNVDIGANAAATAANLAEAINDHAILITAEVDGVNDQQVNLTQTEPVEDGNTEITLNVNTAANFAATDFTGGEGRTNEIARLPGGAAYQNAERPISRRYFALAAPLEWVVNEGGRHTLRVENQHSDNNIEVTVEVSEDGEKFVPINATDHGTAIDGVEVPHRQYREWEFNLRPEVDRRVRVVTTGGGRGVAQIRSEHNFDPILV